MRVVWGDGARLDFDRAVAFLKERSPGAAPASAIAFSMSSRCWSDFRRSRRHRGIADCANSW